jgi:hypothetical protein
MRGFFPLCHSFLSFWHYGIAGRYMTTAIGGGFLSLNKNSPPQSTKPELQLFTKAPKQAKIGL